LPDAEIGIAIAASAAESQPRETLRANLESGSRNIPLRYVVIVDGKIAAVNRRTPVWRPEMLETTIDAPGCRQLHGASRAIDAVDEPTRRYVSRPVGQGVRTNTIGRVAHRALCVRPLDLELIHIRLRVDVRGCTPARQVDRQRAADCPAEGVRGMTGGHR